MTTYTDTERKAEYLKATGKTSLVRELVTGLGWGVEHAIDWVYDSLTLSNEEFTAKWYK